jgi:hypothetical protein
MKDSHDTLPPTALERRRYPRITILEQIHSRFVALNVPVQTCDVSAGGFAIAAPIAFPVGSVHEFLLTRDDGVSLLVTARAIYSRPVVGPLDAAAHMTGFEFVLEDARTWRAVEDLIEHLRTAPEADAI